MNLDKPLIKILIVSLAVIALMMTILPSLFHFAGKMSFEDLRKIMAFGMVLWFLTGSLWLGRKKA